MKIHVQPPRLKTKGKVKRSATWLELYFDLVFVIAIGGLVHQFEHLHTIKDAVFFVTLFIPVWWAWVGHTVYATRFDTDDFSHRLFSIFIILSAIIMRIALQDEFPQGMKVFALGYILARCSLITLYIRAGLSEPKVRKMIVLYVVGFGLGAGFWIVSLFQSYQLMLYFWWIGIVVDFAVPWLGRKKILSRYPLDTSHLPERFGLFTIIVLGETLVGVVSGLSLTGWTIFHMSIGILLFLVSVSIWWVYFGYLNAVDHTRYLGSGQPFIYAHLPLVMGITILGSTGKALLINVMENTFLPVLLVQFFLAIGFFAFSFLIIVRISYREARKLYVLYLMYFISSTVLVLFVNRNNFNEFILLSVGVTVLFFAVVNLNLQKMINTIKEENVLCQQEK